MDRRVGFVDVDADSGEADWYYYLTDPAGSVVAVTDSDGTIVNRYDYDAFGNLIKDNSFENVPNRYQFHGRAYDQHRQDYHYRMRVYVPAHGRFTGPDMKIEPLDPNGACNYLFCRNNPLVYSDPWGLDETILVGYKVVDNKPKRVVRPRINLPWWKEPFIDKYGSKELRPVKKVDRPYFERTQGGQWEVKSRQERVEVMRTQASKKFKEMAGGSVAVGPSLQAGAGTGGKGSAGIIASFNAVELLGEDPLSSVEVGSFQTAGLGPYFVLGASGTLEISFVPSDDITDMRGYAQSVGASGHLGVVIGGETSVPLDLMRGESISQSPPYQTLDIGLAPPQLPAEGHTFITHTWVQHWWSTDAEK